jgi:hypothetical protein
METNRRGFLGMVIGLLVPAPYFLKLLVEKTQPQKALPFPPFPNCKRKARYELAMFSEGKEISGKGYARLQIEPEELSPTMDDGRYFSLANNKAWRFAQAQEDWGTVDVMRLYNYQDDALLPIIRVSTSPHHIEKGITVQFNPGDFVISMT